jgi:hypothetical protein
MTTPPPSTEVIDINALESAKPLELVFNPFEEVLAKWESKVALLKVTDISQKAEMQQARIARLELKEARVNLDKTRKGMVEGLKLRTSKIDTAARIIREKIEEMEAVLLESEKFKERYDEKLKLELKQRRESEMRPFMDSPIFGDLSDLTEAEYQQKLSDAKLLHKTKLEEAAKAEAARKAKEQADRIERERVEEENKKLRAERAKLEAAAAESRKVAEAARLKLESEKRAAELELEKQRKAEMAEKARLEAERKAQEKKAADAAKAPDREKLNALARQIDQIVPPTLADKQMEVNVTRMINALVDQILNAAEAL